MSAPERIWIQNDTKGHADTLAEYAETPHVDVIESFPEYVRADTAATEADALRAEIAELREALERIDDASNHYAMTPTYSEGTLRYAHQSTRNLARAALAKAKP